MIETDRLVAADPGNHRDPRENAMDRAIRPRRLDDYIGQRAVREQMEIFLSAARGRGEPLDHTLIFGPPGLGKTTLASIIAEEMGVQLKTTSGPVLEKAGLFKNGSAGGLQLHPHLFCNDARKCGLAQAWRAEDQGMIQRFPAAARCREEDLHLLPHRTLPDIVVEPSRSDRSVHGIFARVAMIARVGRDKTISLNHRRPSSCTTVILSPLRQSAEPA